MLVFLYPEDSANFVNSVPVKFILLLLCWLVVTAIAFLVYFLYHLPQPRRLVANTWRFTVAIAIISSGASVLGLPRLTSVVFGPENLDVTASIVWDAAAGGSAATVAVSLVLLPVTAWLYFYVVQWEREHGPLIV